MNEYSRTLVIAEAGVNHNGSLSQACALIDAAAEAGADAVKFQTFKAAALISRHAPKAQYQLRGTDAAETQLEMVSKLELSEGAHETLIEHAKTRGVQFLSTPFDADSLRLLTNRFGMRTIKVPSGEITNAPFLVEVARAADSVIVSTGMSMLGEVELALAVLAYGYLGNEEQPGVCAFMKAFASDAGQEALRAHVTLLHCTTEYPAAYAEVNLRAIDTLATAFGLPVGLSDHSEGIHIPVAAVARGACAIEKHFTLDRRLPGPDHAASLEPDELRAMVGAIRQVEAALGDGRKRPTSAEWTNRQVVRKSVVAMNAIRAGEVFTHENLTCKRPGGGVSPVRYWELLGRTAARDYDVDECLDG